MKNQNRSKQEIVNEMLELQERYFDLQSQLKTVPDELEPVSSIEDDAVESLPLDHLQIQKLVDTASIGILVVNQEGIILFANEVVADLFQYDKDSLLDSSLDRLIPASLRQTHQSHLSQYFSDPQPRPMGSGLELVGQRQDGSQFPVEISLSVLQSQTGILVAAFISDVSDLKRSELNFKTIVDTASIGIIIIDHTGNILIANSVIAHIFGYERQDMFGMSVGQLIPESLREQHEQHLAAYFQDPKPRPMGMGFELVGCKQDGSQIPVEISLSAIQSEATTLSVAFVADITERKRAEERFKTLVDTASVGIMVVDREGTIILGNQIAVDYFQYSRHELTGMPVTQLLPVEVRERHTHHLESYFANPEPRPMGSDLELLAQRRDGSQFPTEISLSTVQTDGDPLAVAFIVDISNRKRNEQMREELASKLLTNVGHDLKTPMTAIITRLQLLERTLDSSNYEHTKALTKRIMRLNKIVENILEMTRLDAMDNIDVEKSDVKSLIETLIEEKQPAIIEKNINFTADIDDDLPLLMLNKDLLWTALGQLFHNALLYTPGNGTVHLRADQEKAYVRITLSDTGIGIANDTLPFIFDRFYRGDEARQSGEALNGLGLAMVKRIVELHDGRIEVTSEVDVGSSFTIYLKKPL